MKRCMIYIYSHTPVSKYAGRFLQDNGVTVVTTPDDRVTHLLLGVPNRLDDREVSGILSSLPPGVIPIGGRLEQQGLDLLKDNTYLEKNAILTAHCALRLGMEKLSVALPGTQVLVIGWGRIGRELARLLKLLGADVTVASSTTDHRAEAYRKGFRVQCSQRLTELDCYRLVYNTAPAPIVSEAQARSFREDCVILDLASAPGISGNRPMAAPGLPGKMVPESSGLLIGSTVLRLLQQKEGKA